MSLEWVDGVYTVAEVETDVANEVCTEDMVVGVFPVVLGAIRTSFKVCELLPWIPSSCLISVFICVLPDELVTFVVGYVNKNYKFSS